MRRRSLLRLAASGALAVSLATVGLVAVSGVSSAAKAGKKPPELQYISMGDSYSVGYQNPTLGMTSGFTGYVAKKEKLQLENFGCGGATTTSMFTQNGCPTGDGAGTDAVPYTTDQVDAVDAYIAANPGQVGLVTVSIGGNDVTACADNPDPITCVGTADTTIQTNVTNLVDDVDAALTSAGDTTAHIVGITYPDVILGDDVAPIGSTDPVLAGQSVVAFDSIINPTLDTAYTSVARGAFVDVTDAPYKKATSGAATGSWAFTTGVYTGPTESLSGFGKNIPVSVAEVCDLTWYCNSSTFGDIHANTKGYDFIGKLIVAELATL